MSYYIFWKNNVRPYFSDIRTWIILFFLLRLIGITNPPLEVAHNWRQTVVLMVSRNFYETDSDILYPRVDFAGEKCGITGMEFPLLNYLIYLLSLPFGYTHWYGRIINLIVSSFGIFFFYKIVKIIFNPSVAFYSSLVLLSSLWFSYSRKIMPETFAMSLTLMGMYFGLQYLENNKNGTKISLLLYFIFTLFGIGNKISCGYILILFLPYLFSKKMLLEKKFLFVIITGVMVFLVIGWYFYWVPHLVNTYNFSGFFMGQRITKSIPEIFENWNLVLDIFYSKSIKYTGFAVFSYGLFISFLKRNKILIVFVLSLFSFSVVILHTGFYFYHHCYYVIPFIPVLSLLCGYGLEQIPNLKFRFFITGIILAEGILNQQHDFFIKKDFKEIIFLEKTLDSLSNRKDLIVVNTNNPAPLYFSHRKGWLSPDSSLANSAYLDSIRNLGCRYIVILNEPWGHNIGLDKKILFHNDHYTIYAMH